MKTIQGKSAAVVVTTLATATDVKPVVGVLVPPTQARCHNIVSLSEEDDATAVDLQQETATVGVGPCSTSGNATVTVTAVGMTGTPKAVTVALVQGTAQIEQLACLGTVGAAGAGNIIATVVGALITGGTKSVTVAVANNDTPTLVAGKIRTAFATAEINTNYTVGGATDKVLLTAKVVGANDDTLNISYTLDTATGLTAVPASTTLTPGVAQDTTNLIATKIRAALIADANVGHATTGFFTVTGEDAGVILTKKTLGANDTTMNIAIGAGSTGITAVATSANTTLGQGGSGAKTIEIVGINSAFEEKTETITMNGKVNVVTRNAYRFINSMKVLTCGSALTNVGAITATALTDSTETNRISAGVGESQQGCIMLSKNEPAQKIDKIYADELNGTAAAITVIMIKIKEDGRAWRVARTFQLSKESPYVQMDGGLIIPQKAMVKISAYVSAGSSDINAQLQLVDAE